MSIVHHATEIRRSLPDEKGRREYDARCKTCGWQSQGSYGTEKEADHEAGGHEIAMSHIDENESDYPQRMHTR